MKIPKLSDEEERKAIEWRVDKCGWDSFEAVKQKFSEHMKEVDTNDRRKGSDR